MLCRFYAKQHLEDKLRERRLRVAEMRKEEEKDRMRELGYSTGNDEMMILLMMILTE